MQSPTADQLLTPSSVSGSLETSSTIVIIEGAGSYIAHQECDGLLYTFAPGALAGLNWLSADMLLGGTHLTVFRLRLQEGENGPAFDLTFGLLNQCSARVRVPLEAVNQNRWRYEREGAFLKPLCGGKRVDLSKVDRMELTALRKSEVPSHFELTPWTASKTEPAKLTEPVLPNGPLLDEFGQSALHQWPEKTSGEQELLVRLQTQRAQHAGGTLLADGDATVGWPADFSRWGGWNMSEFEPTGFFRTHHDGTRWWLIDPDGHPFWSAGLDCVRDTIDTPFAGIESALSWLPPRGSAFDAVYLRDNSVNYLGANFIRAFGADDWHDAWAAIALGLLRDWGFNTVANWSEWQIAKAAGFPYVRPLDGHFPTTPTVYRDFPDVFDANFEKDAAAFALQLAETADDPALIGYFLMNEPTWGFAQETPAQGMLFNTEECASRRALADWLRAKYENQNAFESVWSGATFEEVESGHWTRTLTAEAQDDLIGFSSVMVEQFFGLLSRACREVDPNHLNLGARYYTTPPAWCMDGMKHFEVFSMNCYDERIPAEKVSHIAEMLQMPVLIGEWHFGALDAGLPASGIGRVASQAERGQAFRVYTETAAAHPACVGVHYFTLYDQSATGRFDGENYNIGLLDVCNRPYAPLVEAARASHERLYVVASGGSPPFDEAPQYLPKLFN